MRKALVSLQRALLLLALMTGLHADSLQRFLPTHAEPLPWLWWVIPNGQPVSDTIAAWQDWLAQREQPLRPIPEAGFGIGLVSYGTYANQLVDSPAWAVQVAVPLVQTGFVPAQQFSRLVHLSAAARQQGLPMPSTVAGSVNFQQANLILAVAGLSDDQVVEVIVRPSSQPPQVVSVLPVNGYLDIDFLPFIAAYWMAGQPVLAVEVKLPEHVHALADWQWRLHWHAQSHHADGYQQLQAQLQNLLLHTGGYNAGPAFTQADHDRLRLTPEQFAAALPVSNPDNACERAGIWLADSSPPLSQQVSLWRDQSWASGLMPWQQLVRQSPALQPVGQDDLMINPTPGRLFWPADVIHKLCTEAQSCEHRPGLSLPQAAELGYWRLSDEGVAKGAELSRQWLNQPDPFSQGRSLLLDYGADASMPTGRILYQLWLTADGQLWMRDGNHGALLWRWRPRSWLVDGAAPANVPAEYPRIIPDGALQKLGDWTALSERDVLLHWQGRLLWLDLSQAASPRIKGEWGNDARYVASASLLSWLDERWLLLAVQDEQRATMLQLIRPSDGVVVAELADQKLGPITQPFRGLTWQGKSSWYAADGWGRVWRLSRQDESTWQLTSVGHWAEQVPRESSPVALTILRNAQGKTQPVLAMTQRYANQSDVIAWAPSASSTRFDVLPMRTTESSSALSASGWRFTLPENEYVAMPPRWLSQQLLFTTERYQPQHCAPSAVLGRFYELPWQNGAASMQQAATSTWQQSQPILTAAGQLVWRDGSTQTSVLPFRKRLSKQAEHVTVD